MWKMVIKCVKRTLYLDKVNILRLSVRFEIVLSHLYFFLIIYVTTKRKMAGKNLCKKKKQPSALMKKDAFEEQIF